jgi:hypothetical protein
LRKWFTRSEHPITVSRPGAKFLTAGALLHNMAAIFEAVLGVSFGVTSELAVGVADTLQAVSQRGFEGERLQPGSTLRAAFARSGV